MKCRVALLLAAALVASCGDSSEPGEPQADVVLTDSNNFTSMSTLTIPTVQTKSGADLTICWGEVKKDLLCHDVVPGSNGIDNVGFVWVKNQSQAQVSAKLAAGQLGTTQVNNYADYHTSLNPSSTCVQLSDLSLGDKVEPATDYVEDPNGTYMLVFASGTSIGTGARTMTFIEPKASSENTTVQAPDGCSADILDYHATLGAAVAISATDATKWVVGWSALTHDSYGNEVPFSKLKRVMVGFYQERTVDDLVAGFLDIEQTATLLYEVDVPAGHKAVDLADAKLRGTGAAFPGFTPTNGVWMVAVMCDKCQLPAPIALSVLEPQ